MNMYFIAMLAPEEINAEVLKWKHFFRDRFGCSVALKSPAHITLVPPFWMAGDLEAELKAAISIFCCSHKKFTVHLNDFSSFKPKVIFVQVINDSPLDSLYTSFTEYIMSQEKFPVKKDNRPFHPHITLATRDLYKRAFHEAWEVFTVKKYQASWRAAGISLLRHNKKNWDVIFTSQFED